MPLGMSQAYVIMIAWLMDKVSFRGLTTPHYSPLTTSQQPVHPQTSRN